MQHYALGERVQGELSAHAPAKPIRADQSARCWFHPTENIFIASEVGNTLKTFHALHVVQD